jgi:hypothetical protein
MSSDGDPGPARVAPVVVISLEEAARIYRLDPAVLSRVELRLAGKPQRQLASGRTGYFSTDIAAVVASEQASQTPSPTETAHQAG